jgi:hypothetical protein
MKVRVSSKNRAAQRGPGGAVVFRTVVAEHLSLPSNVTSVLSELRPDNRVQKIWRTPIKSTTA